MKPIHKKRLLQLIAFLKALPKESFDFASIRNHIHDCGAVGCAIGWAPKVFPKSIVFQKTGGDDLPYVRLRALESSGFADVAQWLTGLGFRKANALFHPEQQLQVSERLPSMQATATPKQVARMLEKFIKLAEAGELQPA